jgi:hypothetical protein
MARTTDEHYSPDDPAWALYSFYLVMLTTALIVVVVFVTEDLTAPATVLAGLGLALALH